MFKQGPSLSSQEALSQLSQVLSKEQLEQLVSRAAGPQEAAQAPATEAPRGAWGNSGSFMNKLRSEPAPEPPRPQSIEDNQCSQCLGRPSNLVRCSVCQAARYCDAKCQKAAWPQHKLACKKPPPALWKGHVDEAHLYKYNATDGSVAKPHAAQLQGNLDVMVAVLLTFHDRLLLVRHEGKMYLPVAELRPNESIEQAAVRTMWEEHKLRFVPQAVVACEDYPTINKMWFRVSVTGVLGSEEAEYCGSDYCSTWDRTQPCLSCSRLLCHPCLHSHLTSCISSSSTAPTTAWVPLALVKEHEVPLTSGDMLSLLDCAHSSRRCPLPLSAPRVGFPHVICEVALLKDRSVLLVKQGSVWSLPQTHVNKGETVVFSAKRLVRAHFGYLLEPAGLLHVEHNGRSEIGLDGLRFTICSEHLPAAAKQDPNFTAPSGLALAEFFSLDALRERQTELREGLLSLLEPALLRTHQQAEGGEEGEGQQQQPQQGVPLFCV